MNNYERTAAWLAACGKQPGNREHLSTQIACHIEEFAEFMAAAGMCPNEPPSDLLDRQFAIESVAALWFQVVERLELIASMMKSAKCRGFILEGAREEALDALCDMEVTGNGVALIAGMDKVEADRRVLDANDRKLVDGKPVIKAGGKIGKPEGWVAADLSDLV